jgi:hypothetical protein
MTPNLKDIGYARRGPVKDSLWNLYCAEYFSPAIGHVHNAARNRLSSPTTASPVSSANVRKGIMNCRQATPALRRLLPQRRAWHVILPMI